MSRRPVIIASLVVGLVLVVLAAVIFQPWRLIVDQRVDEALPDPSRTTASTPSTPSTPASRPTGATGSPQPVPTPVEPSRRPAPTQLVLTTGTLISHEHATSGSVSVIQLADGRRVLRLTDLDTSNGPDLRVWLSAAPVIEGRKGWFVFDEHAHVDLGALKGNQGSQNYEIPGSADLAELTAVTIWCRRFSVSFGAAALGRR